MSADTSAPAGARPLPCRTGYASPPVRRLQVFSLDPAADSRLKTALVSRSTLSIPWEALRPGPVGEYVEVIDVDPAGGCAYDPVYLDNHHLLAFDGLAPSTGNPQFHQQMVYAVAMKTIANFERVLGRQVMWAVRERDESGKRVHLLRARFVRRLRIHPHALREANAYYSPAKVALLFGYFHATTDDPREELPGGVVFTCLSHDVVAHETTHAVLDGMHRRLLDASNGDSLALHEAFADVVAIFQHFTLPGLLRHQIQATRGDLAANGNLLAGLASQFARATGRGDSLRNALGSFDERGVRAAPDPAALSRTTEPHERGAIFVAAVFDAFLHMYTDRVADLRRIATGGTGVPPQSELHPDLANRFAAEAVEAAQRVLEICIRAIDYLPPADVNFGDFLRGLITADADFFPNDPRRHRLAFIEAFRDRGIYPLDMRALAEDTLVWSPPDDAGRLVLARVMPPPEVLRTMAYAYEAPNALERFLAREGDVGEDLQAKAPGQMWQALKRGDLDAAVERFLTAAWQPAADVAPRSEDDDPRFRRFRLERLFVGFLQGWLTAKARGVSEEDARVVEQNLGVVLNVDRGGEEVFDLRVSIVRPTVRLRQDGRSKVELLVVLTQSVRHPLGREAAGDGGAARALSFKFRGGCTLIIDPDEGRVRYAISKNLASESRRRRQRDFLRERLAEDGPAAIVRYALDPTVEEEQRRLEPFALAHDPRGCCGGY